MGGEAGRVILKSARISSPVSATDHTRNQSRRAGASAGALAALVAQHSVAAKGGGPALAQAGQKIRRGWERGCMPAAVGKTRGASALRVSYRLGA